MYRATTSQEASSTRRGWFHRRLMLPAVEEDNQRGRKKAERGPVSIMALRGDNRYTANHQTQSKKDERYPLHNTIPITGRCAAARIYSYSRFHNLDVGWKFGKDASCSNSICSLFCNRPSNSRELCQAMNKKNACSFSKAGYMTGSGLDVVQSPKGMPHLLGT